MKQLNYKFLVLISFFFFTCSEFKKSSFPAAESSLEEKAPKQQILDSLIYLKVMYFHPDPYKKMFVDNIPLPILLDHKSKFWIKIGSGRKGGDRKVSIAKSSLLGDPVDSFNLVIKYRKMFPDGVVYEHNLYTPDQSYVINDIAPYTSKTLLFPLLLNYPCCLTEQLDLRQQWILGPHPDVPPECPCIDARVYKITPMEAAVKVTSNDTLSIKPVYIHPNPYKEIVVDNVPISVILKHKTKPINSTVSNNIDGKRNIFIPQAIEGIPIDSFNLEISYLNDQSNAIFSPDVPYVVHDVRSYLGTEVVIPYFLDHPCCLDDNLELKDAVLSSEGAVVADCPCK